MSDKLAHLKELARRAAPNPDAREAQRISFAYGNTAIENKDITREDVVRASALLKQGTPTDEPGKSPEPS